MKWSDITPDQAEALLRSVRRQLSFLNRLQRRMERLGFPPADPLYRAATDARNGAADLFVCAHYGTCPSGVAKGWRPPAHDVPPREMPDGARRRDTPPG